LTDNYFNHNTSNVRHNQEKPAGKTATCHREAINLVDNNITGVNKVAASYISKKKK